MNLKRLWKDRRTDLLGLPAASASASSVSAREAFANPCGFCGEAATGESYSLVQAISIQDQGGRGDITSVFGLGSLRGCWRLASL